LRIADDLKLIYTPWSIDSEIKVPEPTKLEAGWAVETVWTFQSGKKSLGLPGIEI
jgi:hypothetical protein